SEPFSVVPPARVRAAVFDGGAVGYSPEVLILSVPYYSLTNATPGGGTVLFSTNGPYRTNTQVMVTNVPAPGWTFLRWEGDLAGTDPEVAVTMNGPRTVRAVFGHPLVVNTQG